MTKKEYPYKSVYKAVGLKSIDRNGARPKKEPQLDLPTAKEIHRSRSKHRKKISPTVSKPYEPYWRHI